MLLEHSDVLEAVDQIVVELEHLEGREPAQPLDSLDEVEAQFQPLQLPQLVQPFDFVDLVERQHEHLEVGEAAQTLEGTDVVAVEVEVLEVAQIDAARVGLQQVVGDAVHLGRCGSGGGMLSAAVHTSSYGSEVDASAHCCTNRTNGRVRLARSIASASDM